MSNEQLLVGATEQPPADVVEVSPTTTTTITITSSSSSSTPRSRMYRRILLVVAIVVCAVLGVYFKHFHRLPTQDILAANLARLDIDADDLSYDDDDVANNDDARRSQRDWDQWIRNNRFVSIGKLFDKCGTWDSAINQSINQFMSHARRSLSTVGGTQWPITPHYCPPLIHLHSSPLEWCKVSQQVWNRVMN